MFPGFRCFQRGWHFLRAAKSASSSFRVFVYRALPRNQQHGEFIYSLRSGAISCQTLPFVQWSLSKVCHFLVISCLLGPLGWLSQPPGVQAYKITEPPISITDSKDPTPARKVEQLLENNLGHDADEANAIPLPHEEGNVSDSNATNGIESFGDRNWEFLLLKVAQLETVVHLQQAELTAAHTEIDALKEHVGLDVQHIAVAKKKSRDPQAAGDVLKTVLDKHQRQRETRNYDPDAHKES
ncbi:unnamed protein product [Symbiodinium sp. CCMP2592]|nr:unnamed protein product [Symbiodinium sp. CCMP2592]